MAGSRNAFASMPGTQVRQPGVLTEQDHNARPPKRVRLSEDAVASIHVQCAQPDTSLEVDHMILDYVAYQTIRACFASRNVDSPNTSPQSLSNNLAMSNAFLLMFKTRYQAYEPDPELRLRILLLKLATLFTQRLTSNPTNPPHSALLDLRATNTQRARHWIRSTSCLPSSGLDTTALDEKLPLSVEDLERNRAQVLQELGIPAEDEDYEDAFYGTQSCVSLLDILPFFIELSAARKAAMEVNNLTEQWMQLACKFMLQACLEQYLVFGAHGSDAADEAFAWGHVRNGYDSLDERFDTEPGPLDDSEEINAMFEDEDWEREVDGWDDMKASYLNKLVPWTESSAVLNHETSGIDVASHFERVAAANPIATFEATLLKFLEAISKSLPDPVLIQLEKGQLHGMTEQETQGFLQDCGIGVAKFFDPPVGFKIAVD